MSVEAKTKIWNWHYELQARQAISSLSSGKSRVGALLKIEFPDGKIGYSDVHPWPELGDLPLAKQLASLRENSLTPLTRNSYRFARLDAEARAARTSLWTGLEIPPNHFLILEGEVRDSQFKNIEIAITEGFTHFKAKLAGNPVQAAASVRSMAAVIGKNGRLRLDFNSQLTPEQYRQLLSLIEPAIPYLDFVEDPTPWNKARGFEVPLTNPRIAVDHPASDARYSEHCPPVLIIKPAIFDLANLSSQSILSRTVIYTSYLDHPVGQMFAAWTAATAWHDVQLKTGSTRSAEICGLSSHTVYEKNEFSEGLRTHGSALSPPEGGSGIGWDELLGSLRWSRLELGQATR